MKNQVSQPYNPQSGSMIVWILIAISLFAALSYVMSQGSRTGASTLTTEQAKLISTEIMEYGNQVRNAVKSIMISNGCTSTDISFENAITGTTYQNATTPANNTCKVFHTSGGGINFVLPPEKVRTSGGSYYNGKYYFVGQTAWQGVGTTCAASTCTDLYIGLGLDNTSTAKTVCEAINNSLGITGIPEDTEWGGSAFNGNATTYNHTFTLGDESGGAAIVGKQEACVRFTSSGGRYEYVKVLVAR